MVIDKAAAADPNIEQLRSHLHQTVLKHGDLLHPEVLRVSQELDHYLAYYFKQQLRRISRPPQDTHS
jgi:hypothetical protein